jgi:ATP-binding cassette subfamily B protein
MADNKLTTFRKLFAILQFQKREISSIYFYAVFAGLVQLAVPVGIQSIISFVLGGAISTSLVLLIIFVILSVFFAGFIQTNQMKITERIQQQLFARYSFRYAQALPNLNMQSVNNYYLPELTNRFFDTISLQKSISKLLIDIPGATIQILFGLVLLSFYHPVFIMFGILLLAVLFAILWYTGNRGLQTSLQESDHKYKVAGYLQEIARTVYSYKFGRNSTVHIETTDEHVTNYLKARTSHFKVLLFQYWTLISFKVTIIAAMLIVGSVLLVGQELNIGQFIAAEMVVMLVIDSVEKLILNLEKVYDVLTSVEKINKLLEKPTEKNGTALIESNDKGISVSIRELTFSFDSRQHILNNVNLTINAGEKIAISGTNGSGKSTLLKVMAGVYPDFSGTLLINDIALSSYDLRKLRSHFGMLFHSQDIIDATIKENICLGDTNITHQKLNDLAEIVGLKEFIQSDQSGYDRHLHPSGQHLPARTIKKILLMRALIHKPKMLLLEEPWLGLEDQHATRIKEYLLNELPATTVIAVANDPSFAEHCNKSIIMSRGTISEIKINQA